MWCPVISGERVYIVAPDRCMTAIDRNTAGNSFGATTPCYRESMGRSADGSRVYAKTMDGELVAIDATTPEFRELWTVDMGLGYEHAPCIVAEHNGIVYAGSRRGIITMVDPENTDRCCITTAWRERNQRHRHRPATGDVYASLIEGTIFRISPRR